MIRDLELKFGPFGEVPPLSFAPGPMTLFVGPNDCGKSLALAEIFDYLQHGRTPRHHIVDLIELDLPAVDEIEPMLRSREAPAQGDRPRRPEDVRVARQSYSGHAPGPAIVNMERVRTTIARVLALDPAAQKAWWREPDGVLFREFIGLLAVVLDGKTRLSLVDQKPAGDLQGAQMNCLAALFVKDGLREHARAIVRDALGKHLVIDPTQLGHFRLRLSARAPADAAEEQALDARAREFHAAATPIENHSDGIRAFVGIVTALISGEHRVMLIDEPDAFLHPPLARRLGHQMATLAVERSAAVFAATHNASFVMGCVDSGQPVNIVRLSRDHTKPTARLLPSDELRTLMHDPLLRSAGVLDSLFHRAAIVCEADADRAFYEEVNRRLISAGRAAVSDGLFLNVNGKQNVRRVVGPLRDMGIPAVAIVDADIVKGTTLRDLVACCNLPHAVAEALGQLRGQVNRAFEDAEADSAVGGACLLTGEDREAAMSLFRQLREYGIFVVPGGGVESWLAELGGESAKRNWLRDVFDGMGTDPADENYLTPGEGDVWAFLEDIALWVNDPERNGMPREEAAA